MGEVNDILRQYSMEESQHFKNTIIHSKKSISLQAQRFPTEKSISLWI